MDSGFEFIPLNVQSGNITGCGNVTDGLARTDDKDRHDGKHQRSIHGQLECLDPDERGNGRRVNARPIKVATSSRDNAAGQETDNHTGGLHDWGSEAFAENDGEENEESQTDEFGASPGQCVRSGNIWAESEKAIFRSRCTPARAASPILEAAFNQRNTNEHDGGASDDGGEDLLEHLWWEEGEGDFGQRTYGAGPDQGAICVGTGQLRAILGDGAETVVIHLGEGAGSDRDNGKGGTCK